MHKYHTKKPHIIIYSKNNKSGMIAIVEEIEYYYNLIFLENLH